MPAPHLTFFVELPAAQLPAAFTPAVIEFLAGGGHAIAMGLLDLTAERAAIVRALEGRGIPVAGWLLLDVAAGYWLNADNPDRAHTRYRDTIAWAERERLRLHRIGLDIEFPRADADLLMRDPRGGLRTLLRRRRAAAQVHAAEAAYADLVTAIRADGRTVESYHFPQLLDERATRSTLLRRTLGVVDVPAGYEVYMLYSSYLGRAAARIYFPDAPCIALGVTGGGVNADHPDEAKRLLSWERLENDLVAAAHCTREVYVFSLEGCIEHDMLGRFAAIRWDRPADDIALRELRAARRKRTLFRWALRAELLFDLFYPARRGSRGVSSAKP